MFSGGVLGDESMVNAREIMPAYKSLLEEFDVYENCWMGHVMLNLSGEIDKEDVVKANSGLYRMIYPWLRQKGKEKEFCIALNMRTVFPYFQDN